MLQKSLVLVLVGVCLSVDGRSMRLRAGTVQHGGGGISAARPQIETLIRQSGADVAVAFRTLDGRDELLIQPDVEYHAASTMKVPVLIELFRQARAGMLALDDQ